MMLPAKIDIIADNHRDKGCFLENAIAPANSNKINTPVQLPNFEKTLIDVL